MKEKRAGKAFVLLVMMSIMLFAMSITGSAATENVDMSIVQEEYTGIWNDESDGDIVNISWSYAINDGEHYHIQYSVDGKTWATKGDTTDSDYCIEGLKAGSTYYVRLAVYEGYHLFDSDNETDTNYVAMSKAVQVKTASAAPSSTELMQKAATLNSVTIKWAGVTGAESYNVYRYENSKYNLVASGITAKTAKIKGLSPSGEYEFYVAAVRTGAGGYQMIGNKTKVTAKTKSDKVSGLTISSTSASGSLSCKYQWNKEENSDGYQIQILSLNGKKTYYNKKDIDSWSVYDYMSHTVSGCSYGRMTKTRVRSYILINDKKVYGPWSSYCYNGVSKKTTATRSTNGKKITLKWKKVTGASKYIVYISTKEDSGYKKAATLSSKKTKYVIKKYKGKTLKKSKTYYVKVVSVYKKGSKSYKSSGSSVIEVNGK